MNTINDRIKTIAETYYNGNIRELERTCGLNKDTLKHVVAGRFSKPSFDTIEAIIRTHVLLSPLWLIIGEGEMERAESSNLEIIEELKAENNMLKGENRVLREQLGLGARKESKGQSA